MFTHACEEDGVFTSFFIDQQSHCQEVASNLPPCCQKEKKKNCCHDEKTVLQLDEKYVQSQGISIPSIAVLFLEKTPRFNSTFHHSAVSQTVETWEDPPPIRKAGKALLIQHCIFRI